MKRCVARLRRLSLVLCCSLLAWWKPAACHGEGEATGATPEEALDTSQPADAQQIDNGATENLPPRSYDLNNPTWMAELNQVLYLRSTKERHPQDATAVSHFTLDRLDFLERLCVLSWSSVVSAVIYVPLVNGVVGSMERAFLTEAYLGQDLSTVLPAVISKYYQWQNSPGSCTLDLSVWTENLPETSYWYLYPVNSMRNRALMQAQTDLVLLLDADFMVAPTDFADRLREPNSNYEWMLRAARRKLLMVLPAFRTNFTMADEDATAHAHRITGPGKRRF